MNHQLREDIAVARVVNVEMAAQCNDMLARLDGVEGAEAATIRERAREILAQIESWTILLDEADRVSE